MTRTRACILILTCLACEGGDVTPPPAEITEVASIQLEHTSFQLSQGATQPLNPVYRDRGGALLTQVPAAEWTSSNAAVASVDQTGHATGVSLGGPVTISVVADGITASAVVTAVVPDRIRVSPALSTLAVGEQQTLVAVPIDFNGRPIAIGSGIVTFSTSDPAVANVHATSGLLSALTAGDAVISATFAGRTSGLQLKTGVRTPLDGTWSAVRTFTTPMTSTNGILNLAVTTTSELSVVFGTIDTFKSTFSTGGSCSLLATATATPAMVIPTSNQFAFQLAPTTAVPSAPPTVSGSFSSDGLLSLTQSAISFGAIGCNGGSLGTGTTVIMNVPASSFAMSKQ